MVGKYKVITLCGSTCFKDEFMGTQKRLTLEGNIVISVGLFGHSGDDEVWTEGTKGMLDDMHKRKIDMADEIFVINVGAISAAAPGLKSNMPRQPESLSVTSKTGRIALSQMST